MALRYVVTRMRSPAAAALRPPSVYCGSTAARPRSFSANTSQGEQEERLKMIARGNYEFHLDHLERVRKNLDYVRVFTERCGRAMKYMSRSYMVVMPAYSVFIIWKASRKPESSSNSVSTST